MSLMKEAGNGIITPQIKAVAEYEGVDPEIIRKGVAEGKIAIPVNPKHSFSRIRGIGKGLRTKVNANIGSSPYHMDIEEELEKMRCAVEYGADAVMDLSLGADMIKIRREIIRNCDVMVGTVPIYQTGFELSAGKKDIVDMEIGDFLNTVRRQAEEGVDFMTIHSGVNRSVVERMNADPRMLDVVSRGGSMLVSWMRKNGRESPLYEYYDEILDILAEYDVTISLGDGMRPGATADATDSAQIAELITLGELAGRAWEKGVQVMIEGPGHVPMNMVRENMTLQKRLCREAPFYVLGPLVTDCASGYDHIAGAIGGALAAYSGADFLCYVTPAEHLRLPTTEHVKEGVIASRIAARAADLANGMSYALEDEQKMASARKALDWKAQIELSVDPEKARSMRESSEIGSDDVCTMCGEFCAVKRLNE